MALVAYSSSEHEDSEDDEAETTEPRAKVAVEFLTDGVEAKVNGIKAAEISDEDDDEEMEHGTLLSNLPQPTAMPVIEETTEDVIPSASRASDIPAKKTGTKIKIEAPKLLDDDEEDEAPTPKKPKPTNTLLAMLPQPKSQGPSNTRFVPNSVAQKRKAPPQVKKPDDDSGFDEKLWNQLFKRKSKPVTIVRQEPPPPKAPVDLTPEVPAPSKNNVSFREFVKSKSTVEVDVVRDVVIDGEGDVEQLKALTDPEYEKPKSEEEPVNSTCKKKHHITYLAQQARANEQDLKNQWAANKMNRFQTRAKYGF